MISSNDKSDSGNLPKQSTETPKEKIEKAFCNLKELKPDYHLRSRTLSELFLVGGQSYWKDSETPINPESYLHRSPSSPGMPVSKHPNSWQDCNLNKSTKEIERINKAAKELQEAIVAIHQPTIYALKEANFHTKEIETLLIDAITATEEAKSFVNDWKEKEPELIDKIFRISTTDIPFHIAMILAEEYHSATGKPPTVSYHGGRKESYGEFLNLVEAVFKALGISEKSADGTARNAEDLWKKRRKIQDKAEQKINLRKIKMQKTN